MRRGEGEKEREKVWMKVGNARRTAHSPILLMYTLTERGEWSEMMTSGRDCKLEKKKTNGNGAVM